MITLEMSKSTGKPVLPGDVMFTVAQLSRKSQENEAMSFRHDIGKIQRNHKAGVVVFDMSEEDAIKLIQFNNEIHDRVANFRILKELEIERGRIFGILDKPSNSKGFRKGYKNEWDNGRGYNKKRGKNDGYRRDNNRRDRYYENSVYRSRYRDSRDVPKGKRYSDNGW
jgi:hypothetical protein